jgi:hypothetical protein
MGNVKLYETFYYSYFKKYKKYTICYAEEVN